MYQRDINIPLSSGSQSVSLMQDNEQKAYRAGSENFTFPGQSEIGTKMRAAGILICLLVFTLPVMAVQGVLLRLSSPYARMLPHWYHRKVCRLLGIRLNSDGKIASDRPVLIVANHISWLDISVLSAVAPVSFVAKSEVESWPFISWLAKLQRTVFVKRQCRTDVGRVVNEMAERFSDRDALVVFAEGTSTDGNRVLSFHSSLLSPAFSKDSSEDQDVPSAPSVAVQTLSIAYTHLHGIPLGRDDRKLVAWYGDMEMAIHVWELLKAGPLDVRISISEPVMLKDYQDRKQLARFAEEEIRANVVLMLRGRIEAGSETA